MELKPFQKKRGKISTFYIICQSKYEIIYVTIPNNLIKKMSIFLELHDQMAQQAKKNKEGSYNDL